MILTPPGDRYKASIKKKKEWALQVPIRSF
jgi:hypothetical protein